MAKIAIKERVNIIWIAKGLVLALSGFLLANTELAGIPSPLAASLIAAIPIDCGIWAVLGSLGGLLASGYSMNVLIFQGIAIIGTLLSRFVIASLLKREIMSGGRGLLGGICVIAAGIFSGIMLTGGVNTALVTACQGVLAGCGAYFLHKTISTYSSEGKLILTGSSGACLGCCYVLGIAAICSVQVGVFNLGRAVSVLVLLVSARHFKHLGGAVCGALATCGVVLFSPDLGAATMLLPAAGMVAGLFGEFGRLPTAFFLISANAVGLIVLGVTPDTARMLIDVSIGAAAFVILPEPVLPQLIGNGIYQNIPQHPSELASSQLYFAAKGIGEIQQNIEKISSTLQKAEKEPDLVNKVCMETCSRCNNNLVCWEREFDRTNQAFHIAGSLLEERGILHPDELPDHLKNCYRRTALTQSFQSVHREIQRCRVTRQRLQEVEDVLFQQMDAMQDALNGIAANVGEPRQWDKELSDKIQCILREVGAESPKVGVFWDKSQGGRMKIEAYYHGKLRKSPEEISEELSNLTEKEFDTPFLFGIGKDKKFVLMEKPNFDIITAFSQSAAEGETLSGDSIRSFYDGNGNACFVLSDGMGTGKQAAVDSAMTVSLLVKMLKSGIAIPAAVRIINSSLCAKSSGSRESFATLDAAVVSCYTGRLTLYKLGSSTTFVKRGNHVITLEAELPPIGIIAPVSIDSRSASLSNGDVVVLLSDGVPEECYQEIRGLIMSSRCESETDLKILSQRIINIASDRTDDVTVMLFSLI